MTPGGKHQKELKKVYKNKKDANDYMAAIMIAKKVDNENIQTTLHRKSTRHRRES